MAAVMGGLLVLVGLVLMSTHLRTRRGNRDLPRDDPDRVHIDRQFRRRMRTSGTISLLGVAIAIGDVLPILHKNPGLFGIYWICVLLLTVWVMLQGFGDYCCQMAIPLRKIRMPLLWLRSVAEQPQQRRPTIDRSPSGPARPRP